MADIKSRDTGIKDASADVDESAAYRQVYCELYDDLTGLPGMNNFFRLAESRKAGLIAEGRQAVLLFFDFNGMKNYNIRFGFAEGDRLILAMAEILKSHFGRENCARFGGDRFAVRFGIHDQLAGFRLISCGGKFHLFPRLEILR